MAKKMFVKKVVSEAPKCRICGKALEDPESIKKGIGPDCESRYGLNGDPSSIKVAKAVKEVDPKTYMQKSAAIAAAVAAGIPAARFWIKACGGNRGFAKAISPDFTPVFFRGKWYVPKASVNKANLAMLLSMERKPAGRKGKVDGKVSGKAPEKKAAAPAKKAAAKPAAKKSAEKPVSQAPAKKAKALPVARPVVKTAKSEKGTKPAGAVKVAGAKKPVVVKASPMSNKPVKDETVIIGGTPVTKGARTNIANALNKIKAEQEGSQEAAQE